MNANIDSELAQALREEVHFSRSDEELAREVLARAEVALPTRRPRRRWTGGRRSVSIALTCVLVAGGTLAVAQADGLRTLFGGDASKPANKVDALQHPENALDMSVFADATSASPDQRLVAMLTGALYGGDSKGYGKAMPSFARILVDSDQNGLHFRLAAMPTTTGDLCIAANAPGQDAASCIKQLDDSRPVNAVAIGRDGHEAVFGAATDNVQSVTVKLSDGSVHPAQTGKNSFVWIGPSTDAPSQAQAIATLKDGSKVTVNTD